MHVPHRGLTAAVAVVTLAVLSGCGGAGDSTAPMTKDSGPATGTLTIWGGANLVGAAQVVLEGFKKKNSGVNLAYQAYPFAQYPTKMRLQLSSGANTPDVMVIHDYFVRPFVKRGWLEDLSADLKPEDYLPSSLQDVTDGSKIYGVPGQSNPTGFWYRKDVFDQLGLKAPTTMDDYVAAAKALKAAGHYIDAFDPNAATGTFLYYLYQSGGSLFDAKGQIALGSPAVAALDQLKAQVDAGYFDKVTPNQPDYWTAVNSGKIVARMAGSSDAAYLGTNLDPRGQGGFGKWAYADPPKFSDEAPATYLIDGSFWVVNAKSRNKSSALKLVEYLAANPDAALGYDNIAKNGVVVRQTPSDLASLKAVESGATGWDVFGGQKVNAAKAKLLLSTKDLTQVYRDSRSTAAEDAITQILPKFFSGQIPAQAAVDQMTTKIGAIKE
jgi:ABC-type glycerol-3-phosphate transport system substrate-binding protein